MFTTICILIYIAGLLFVGAFVTNFTDWEGGAIFIFSSFWPISVPIGCIISSGLWLGNKIRNRLYY